MFAAIRLVRNPVKMGRESRFYGSHTGAAWFVLFMIFNVVWTLLLYRGAQYNVSAELGTDNFPFMAGGAFASEAVAAWLAPLGLHANEWIEMIGLWLNIGVILGFLVLALHSKHLHIGAAPLNVLFSRRPNALGPLLPIYAGKEVLDFEDLGMEAIWKIDVVDFNEDLAKFVSQALSPARVSDAFVIDAATKAVRVLVPDFQLSLAIGKEGQNARLAAKLTGAKIDIQPDSILEG
jgi:hypothetical protein